MHEYSLAKAIYQEVKCLKRQHGAGRVESIRVGVGDLCGAEPELLKSAFQLLIESGGAEPAQFEVQRIPLEARCSDCGTKFALHRFCFACPNCKCQQIVVTRGEDLILEQVTFAEEDSDE